MKIKVVALIGFASLWSIGCQPCSVCAIGEKEGCATQPSVVSQEKGSIVLQEKSMINALNEREKTLVILGALGGQGDIDRLKQVISHGFEHGVTVSEMKEALSHLYAYAGFPRSLNALGALSSVIDARKESGLAVDEGKEADATSAQYDALKQGTEVQTMLTGQPFNYTFAPQTDYYLKAHLFGDIFARNNLSYSDRELVTVGIISSLEGCGAQLTAHIKGARNMGVSDDVIKQIPLLLADKVGKTSALRAQAAIESVLGKTEQHLSNEPDFVFPKGDPNVNYAQYFIGNSYLATLATGEGKLGVANVTFEPGTRNNWHIHHKGGQILICVSGRGWYQEWGKPAQELHPGDTVDIPAEAKHWHGAAKDSWFQHIAIGVPAEGGTNEWLEPVTDEEYMKLP